MILLGRLERAIEAAHQTSSKLRSKHLRHLVDPIYIGSQLSLVRCSSLLLPIDASRRLRVISGSEILMGGFSLAALSAATVTAVAAALLAHPSTRRHLLPRSAKQDATTSRSRLARWLGMWEAGRTNFHQTEPHHILVRYKDLLLGNGADKPLRVFVPLCGKTVDLPWLAQQSNTVAEVIGNEAAEMAVAQFAKV